MAETETLRPFTRPVVHCPDCAVPMSVVTRQSERATPDAPEVWSCGKCKTSWSVPVVRLDAVAVAFDNGTRPKP